MRHRRWSLGLVLALAIGWLGGIASPSILASQRQDLPASASNSWTPVENSLAFAAQASSVHSRLAIKHLGASQPTALARPLPAVQPSVFDPDGQASPHFSSLICMPLRC
jgi:hypothetical protein